MQIKKTHYKDSVFRDISVKITNGNGFELENAENICIYGLRAEGCENETGIKNSENIQIKE